MPGEQKQQQGEREIDYCKERGMWMPSSRHITLTENDVHVWRISLDVASETLYFFQSLLCEEELARAKRFRFVKDRLRWCVARGTLRQLLGRYLETNPRTIRFNMNMWGKPFIASPSHGTHLQFNISHSADLALCAFTYNRRVGIDVEYMRDGVDYMLIARQMFSEHEQATLKSLPEAMQREAFFLCWSRKEAYVKARGEGLTIPLRQFEVSLTPGEPAALLHSEEDPHTMKQWSLHTLTPAISYAGALVVEGTDWRLSRWKG